MSNPPSSNRNSKRYTLSENPSKHNVPREIRFGNYVLGTTLGEGEFGKVKLGWRKDGKLPSQTAIKLIKRKSIPSGSVKEGKIYREITALKRLRHPNIVRLVEVLQNDKYIGIVLEYAPNGELFDYILENKHLKESSACRLFAQLVSAVDYMHAKGIVHRDLKLENILLDEYKNIIITDFGFVNSFTSMDNSLMKTSCGSPCYAAPELVVSSEPYEGKKVDIWSCGVILYAMLAGYLPFDDDPENPDGSNIARLYHYITHTPLTFPEYIQPTPRDLLRRILVSNPNKRISLREIKTHRWLHHHFPFLHVTAIEWDRDYKSSKILTQQERANRRMSLMENPTSASLMLNNSNIRSYSSQNIQTSLYSNPAAPQTSRTVAIPSAETSPVSSPIRKPIITSPKLLSTTSSNNNNNNNETMDAKHLDNYTTRHSRSGSTASIVLQAVVDADVQNKRRYSNGSTSDILTTPSRNSNQRPISFAPVLLDNNNKIETIKESPEHKKILPPVPSPIFKKPVNLPTRSNKPRPTSYHPSYSSNSLATPDLTFMANSNYSESSLKGNNSNNKRVNHSSTYSSTSESLISVPIKQTPIPESELSRDDIKLDDHNESKEQLVNNNNNNNNNTSQNYYAMDVLNNAFESLSMIPKAINSTFERETGAINIYDESSNRNKNELVSLVAISPSSTGNKLTNGELADSEKENLNGLNNELMKTRNILSKTNTSIAALSSNSNPTGNISSTTPTSNNASNTKYKRFSLLTFYQSMPGPTAPSTYIVHNNEMNSNSKSLVNDVYLNNNQAHSKTSVTSASKIPQIPTVSESNEPEVKVDSPIANPTLQYESQKQRIVTPNSIHSTSSSKSRPRKQAKASESSSTTTKSERRVSSINVHSHDNKNNNDKTEKETSTARKVMDFFKRRSMRI